MKRLVTLLVLTSGSAMGGCGTPPSAQVAVAATHTATFEVDGMTCASCSVTVRTAVHKLDGISDVKVDVPAERAVVMYDGAAVTAEQIADAITRTGYQSVVLYKGEV